MKGLSKSSKIAIVGASVGGLTLARALLRSGFTNVSVFERFPASHYAAAAPTASSASGGDGASGAAGAATEHGGIRSRGVIVASNAMRVYDRLGLASKVASTYNSQCFKLIT